MDGASYDVVCPLLRGGEASPAATSAGDRHRWWPSGGNAGWQTLWHQLHGRRGQRRAAATLTPQHWRITSAANRCICSSTSSVLYPPPSNHAVNMKRVGLSPDCLMRKIYG